MITMSRYLMNWKILRKRQNISLYKTNLLIRFRPLALDIVKQKFIYVRLMDLMEVIQKQVFLIRVSQLQDHKQG